MCAYADYSSETKTHSAVSAPLLLTLHTSPFHPCSGPPQHRRLLISLPETVHPPPRTSRLVCLCRRGWLSHLMMRAMQGSNRRKKRWITGTGMRFSFFIQVHRRLKAVRARNFSSLDLGVDSEKKCHVKSAFLFFGDWAERTDRKMEGKKRRRKGPWMNVSPHHFVGSD